MLNWKKFVSLGLLLGALQCGTALAAEPAAEAVQPQVKTIMVNTSTDKVITPEELVASLEGYDALFFGEYHDQDVLHAIEFEIFKSLYAKYGDNLVLSMEMFEADNQDILDDYLDDEVSEDNFLANSRPWPRYKADYRKMVEFAKAHKLPVVAANIPRFMAHYVAVDGNTDKVGYDYKKYLPRETNAPEGAYKDKFFGHMSRGEAPQAMQQRMDRMFAAQCIKDDKMAESIYDFLQEKPQSFIYHVNGCFHSDSHLGTVERLQQRAPGLKIAVLSSKDLPEDGNYLTVYENQKKIGEYIVYFTRVEQKA